MIALAIDSSLTARVIAAYGRQSIVEDAARRQYEAVRRGKRGDVIVGDTVYCTQSAEHQVAIDRVELRRNVLFRDDGNRTKELAANVDQIVLVFAAQPAFNLHFLWRALLAASAAGIQALVLLNKLDLPQVEPARAALHFIETLGYATLSVSAKHSTESARALLQPKLQGRISLLVGQSGMGKSTLLNLLVPQAQQRTQEFSAHLNLGKQTTTATRWFDLPTEHGGGALIDTPGFQAFGLAHLDLAQLAGAMPDIAPHLGHCRFNDCRHLHEPGCGVRTAAERGELAPERYAFYADLATQELSRSA